MSQIQNCQEIRPVLEYLKAKMQAKTHGINQLSRIKNTLQLVTNQNHKENFTLTSEPQIIVNEEDD